MNKTKQILEIHITVSFFPGQKSSAQSNNDAMNINRVMIQYRNGTSNGNIEI